MILNQLNVMPSQDTLDYLSAVMSGSPLDIDMSTYSVEIITTLDAVKAEPVVSYSASCLNLRIWYDSFLQRSSLILTLDSADLQQRALQLASAGVLREFYNFYNPNLVMCLNMPPLSRHYRSFVHQLANSLCSNERPLVFDMEYVTQVDLLAPANMDYNNAMFLERSGG